MIDHALFRSALLDPDAACPTGLSDGRGAPAGRRFDVYRNNVAVSLTEALETAFPVLAKLVGAANFKLLAGAFLRAHPPRSPVMMHYGAKMPAFLAAFEPTRAIAYLPDIARLEIARRESYHAADAVPMDAAKLEAMAPDALMASRVDLAPALRVIRSRWPIHAIWRFNTEEDAPKPAMQPEDVLIVRPEFDPLVLALPPGAAAFIAALRDGEPFSAAFDAGGAEAPEFDLGGTLGLLLAHGAITDIGEI